MKENEKKGEVIKLAEIVGNMQYASLAKGGLDASTRNAQITQYMYVTPRIIWYPIVVSS